MKKILVAVLVVLLFSVSLKANALDSERKGHFRLGAFAPGLFIGNKNINTMMALGLEGEYFFMQNLSASFKIQEATDFKFGNPPHSVLTFVARARYIFDIGDSGDWAAYVQAGAGGGLIGSKQGCGDVSLPGGGFWYQWYKDWFIGLDSNLHILIRDPIAIAFDIMPAIRYQF
ncbi:MAG: hypothetical protein COS89_07170 [Deltaproteobacteria bacterium CG07_land_8_20_14_0_80_38_7]|nr:MAG: hypothetical protein COS89_07170 [Deltaproteobacteria bacterium CG07_land_8_20_14_0_80_38_7]